MKKIIFVLFFCYSSFFNISSFSEEKKPWLGISVKPSGDKEIKLVISNVEPKSPADVSDLKKNDLLKSLNGKNIKNSIDFIRQFNKLKLGQEINITVKRNNKLIKKKIKLIGKEINLASEKYVEKEYTAGFAGIPSYRDIKNLNYYKSSKLKKIIDGNKNEYLIISCIYKGTDASEKLRLYDKITEINNKPIRKSSGLTSLADKEIQVTILRGSKILKEKIQNIKRENLYQHQLNCIKEHLEYECQDFVNIAPDRRKENYWEEIFECLNKKKVNTIPIGTLSWDLRWIKLKSLEKLIKKYSLKKTRDLEKLKYYVPIALEALSEFENYQLSHTKTDVKGEDEYKRLVKTISYSIRYAQVRGIKGIEKYNINLGLKTVANTKKDLENILNKSKLEIYDLEYIDDSFDILLNRKENEYIKKIWPKLINKIDWENIYKYSGKFSPKENTIKSFQIFLDLGDLYIEEQNFKKSVDIYELGLKNLENWKKNNEINLYYIVYKRKFVVSYATPKTFLLVTEYNANLNNKKKADKAFQKLKSISDELKNIEKSFYLLNSDIQLQIRKRYPKHLIYVYQSLQTSNQFLQDKKESYVWAKKLYEETKSLPKNRDNISDMFEAHYTMIIASLGVNRLQVANYHINEFKNYSLRLVENVNGVKDVASFSSFMLPFMLHAGLYYEAEELLNFVENYLDFNQQIFGNFQRDSFFYTLGRIKLKNKEYKKAISSFEIASKEFMNNPSANIQLNYSALSSLMLLEAYLMNNDLDKFKKHFFNLTNSYPENYRSFSETKPSKYFYIPSDIAMSQVFSVINYLKKKDIQLKKNEAKEIISLLKDEFKEYTPGEESKIEMIKYAVKIASEIFDANNDSTVKFIKHLKDEIQQEYSNAFFNSNLSPNHKIDDLISGLLNVSYKAENEKIFSSNYQLIQIVSNSVTSRDLRKSFNKKKFKEIKHRKLIDEYQKLQILKNSIYISDEFSSFKKKELKDLNAQSFNSFERSSKIDKKILEIEKKIKSEIPEYFSKIKPTGSKLSTIKKKLNNKDLFLEYFFFENKTYVIIVTNKNYKILKLNLKKDDLERLAQNIKQSLTIDENGNLNKYNVKSSFELYSKIFKPIEKFLNNKSNIILAPNSFLNFIPMHILPTSGKNNCFDCSRISWLKDKYNFTYIPNSEFFTLKKKPLLNFSKLLSNKKPFYLGIGNPDLEPDIENLRAKNKNQDLKVITSMLRGNNFIKDTSEIGNIYTSVIGSEEEIKKISEILKPLKSDLLLKSEANEKKLKSMSLQDYKIIHFATHGELAGYIKGKNEPFLVLTPPKIGTEENDGLLNLSEIMSLELNANLVILSACNTASNNIREAEGFTGLARAFLYAGSNSVMVSNWYIETFAAQELTTNFVQNLREKNINNSEALTISMNKLSQDPQTSHPFYWGPFVIVGLIDNLKINS